MKVKITKEITPSGKDVVGLYIDDEFIQYFFIEKDIEDTVKLAIEKAKKIKQYFEQKPEVIKEMTI